MRLVAIEIHVVVLFWNVVMVSRPRRCTQRTEALRLESYSKCFFDTKHLYSTGEDKKLLGYHKEQLMILVLLHIKYYNAKEHQARR